MVIKTLALVMVMGVAYYTSGLDNGLAILPPMGWSSSERFGCNTNCYEDPDNCVSERLFMEMADILYKDNDWKYSSYKYVIIGDCWSAQTRDKNGTLMSDHYRFPSGIRALADYMHGRGLKLGIYADVGTETCNGYPGSQMYMEKDAQTFADWGVDYVHMDACNVSVADMRSAFPTFGHYLNLTKRPILYACEWPKYEVKAGLTPDYPSIAKVCNTWRNYRDVQDTWDSVLDIISFYGNNTGNFLQLSGPGQYNDPGELVLGDFGLSIEQQRAQLGVWALMAAPLIMSNDLRKLPPEPKKFLTNFGVMMANQDQYGAYGRKMMDIGKVEVWGRELYPRGKSLSYAFLNKNRAGGPTEVQIPLYKLGLNTSEGYNVTQNMVEPYGVRFIGVLRPTDLLNVSVNPSGVYFGHADFDC